jgi:hypothetical protein
MKHLHVKTHNNRGSKKEKEMNITNGDKKKKQMKKNETPT